MNVTINPGAALDDAQEIESIVSKMKVSMEDLDKNISSAIEVGIVNVKWAETLLDNWRVYKESDVPEAMNQMLLSAANLKKAVDAVIAYSNEQA